MNIKNTNYLEFNRDLFLCNSIRDISNEMPIPMITSDRNEVYHLKVQDFNMPFIDTKWKIYMRELKPSDDNGTLSVLGPRIGPPIGSSIPTDYYNANTATGYSITVSKNVFLSQEKFNMIKNLKDNQKIDHADFKAKFQDYLNRYDVYVGPGEIKHYPKVENQLIGEINGQPVYNNTPEYCSIVNGTLTWLDPNFVGQCSNYNLQTNCEKLDATDINDVQQNQETCEICKNFQYRDWFDDNEMNIHGTYAKNKDTSQEYIRSWLQTWNLGIGIILLTTGIYYQLKK
jgi:hypothetical protein